jgi:hypothetical protein
MAAPPQHRATNAGRPLTVATNPFALFGSVALGGDRVDASSSRDPLGGAGHALRRGRDGWPHDRRHGQGRRLHHALGQHRVLVRARRRAPGLHALRRPDGVVGAPPQRPADCDNDWGGAITLEVRAAFGCVGDTVAGLAGLGEPAARSWLQPRVDPVATTVDGRSARDRRPAGPSSHLRWRGEVAGHRRSA